MTWNEGWFDAMPALPTAPLERAACLALLAFAAALQLSIAAADIFLTIAAFLWAGLLIKNKERVEVPRMFWPLAAYAGATLVATVSVETAVEDLPCRPCEQRVCVHGDFRCLTQLGPARVIAAAERAMSARN